VLLGCIVGLAVTLRCRSSGRLRRQTSKTRVSTRILIVDDFEPWRRHMRSVLEKTPHWHVVGEASDGFAALQKAEALQPDVMLLDISALGLNGIEVSRRIRDLCPNCRILAVSEHRALEIVEKVFESGALGYVIKSDAGRELLPAVKAVANSEWFLSVRLRGAALDVAGAAPKSTDSHWVGLYSDDSRREEACARFVGTALHAGHAVVVIADEAERARLEDRMRANGIEIDRAVEEHRCRTLPVADVVSKYLGDGRSDEKTVTKGLMSLLFAAAIAAGLNSLRVALCAAGAASVWREENVRHAAIHLEHHWQVIARTFHTPIFCAYSLVGFGDADDNVVGQICAEHSAVVSL
jgi:DNA-binding NarL/FixJ family response regulator